MSEPVDEFFPKRAVKAPARERVLRVNPLHGLGIAGVFERPERIGNNNAVKALDDIGARRRGIREGLNQGR